MSYGDFLFFIFCRIKIGLVLFCFLNEHFTDYSLTTKIDISYSK